MKFPKHEYVRNKKLLHACRKIPCQSCGIEDGTVCAAHANSGMKNKGMAVKADDSAVSALCYRCHMEVDQGRSMSRSERTNLWKDAHVKTVKQLLKLGLWPLDVPVPDIGEFTDGE